METLVTFVGSLSRYRVPSRRGNQLNGNRFVDGTDRLSDFFQVPSRRGNQLNGNPILVRLDAL